VIEPTSGEPVGPGEYGELVITPFVAQASPLIRFATGDRVQVADRCECGRPGIGLVSGRVNRFDHMLKVKGVNLWPEALDNAVFSVEGVREYEASVEVDAHGREALTIAVEAGSPGAADAVATEVRESIGISAEARMVEPGSLAVSGDFTKRVRLTDRRPGKERQPL
jgi:phenylacetate-CoA ligase